MGKPTRPEKISEVSASMGDPQVPDKISEDSASMGDPQVPDKISEVSASHGDPQVPDKISEDSASMGNPTSPDVELEDNGQEEALEDKVEEAHARALRSAIANCRRKDETCGESKTCCSGERFCKPKNCRMQGCEELRCRK